MRTLTRGKVLIELRHNLERIEILWRIGASQFILSESDSKHDGFTVSPVDLPETGRPIHLKSRLRQFEKTGQIEFAAFLALSRELDVLHLFLALARNEEPETFHKIAKEKAISRLQDRLALATGEITPEELLAKNTRILTAMGITRPTHWRIGKGKWMECRSQQQQVP